MDRKKPHFIQFLAMLNYWFYIIFILIWIEWIDFFILLRAKKKINNDNKKKKLYTYIIYIVIFIHFIHPKQKIIIIQWFKWLKCWINRWIELSQVIQRFIHAYFCYDCGIYNVVGFCCGISVSVVVFRRMIHVWYENIVPSLSQD